jgi:hypothetical protein
MREHWGEYFYSKALKASLEALNHTVRIDFHGTWYDAPEGLDDIVIVLRGRDHYVPQPGEMAILWVISHPDQVPYEEYEVYDAVFVASLSYPALLSLILRRDVRPLLQCSDPKTFFYQADKQTPTASGVFVGNSRNASRPIVEWAAESLAEVRIYGQDWLKFAPKHLIAGEHIPNDGLARIYAQAKFVLNDHWESMKDFGIISNRVFDVVGCGGHLISDALPSIPYIFGDVVCSIQDAATLSEALTQPAEAVSSEDRRRAADYVHAHHSFDARAAEICRSVESLLQSGHLAAPAVMVPFREARKTRVGLLLHTDIGGRPSADAFVRLICPLTADAAQADLDLVILDGASDPRLSGCEAVVAMSGSVPKPDQAEQLAKRLSAANTPLFVDDGDPTIAGDVPDAPQAVRHILMGVARQVWCATASATRACTDTGIAARTVPNRLDPRLWQTYSGEHALPWSEGPVRFLYLRPDMSLDDSEPVHAAFTALHTAFPDQFQLTIMAPGSLGFSAPWVTHIPIEGQPYTYPFLARQLTRMGRFDAGIAPMRRPNPTGSDIRFLEYSALGIASLVSEHSAFADHAAAGLAVVCESTQASWLSRLTDVLKNRRHSADLRHQARNHLWQNRNVMTWTDGPANLINI